MKIVVGISDMQISVSREDLLVTHGLGSCIGVVVYDPILKIGGMLHYMLPQAGIKAKEPNFNPFTYGDSGIQIMIREMVHKGCKKGNLVIVMAGGSAINSSEKNDFFAIGKRNHTIAKKVFWKEQILVTKEHVGGNISRSLYLDMQTGNIWFMSKGTRFDLFGGI